MLFVHLASLLVRSPGPVQPWHHPSHLLPSRCYLLLVKWMTRHANIFLISRSTSLGAISGAALVELIREYCERPESKAQARLHFDLARKLIQQAQTDSKVLESLESALRTPERPKN